MLNIFRNKSKFLVDFEILLIEIKSEIIVINKLIIKTGIVIKIKILTLQGPILSDKKPVAKQDRINIR